MVGVRVPLVVEGRKGSLRDSDSLSLRRGSGVSGKPLLKTNSRKTLVKKNSRTKIKTVQVAIQLEGTTAEEKRNPQLKKRRSVQKICLPSSTSTNKSLLSKRGSSHKICLPPSSHSYDLTKPQFTKRRSVTSFNQHNTGERKTALLPTKVNRRALNESNEKTRREEAQCEAWLAGICLEDFTTFQTESLHYHNKYRARHRVDPLVLDTKVCQVAQEYAEHLATTNTFEHSNDSVYGENLYWGFCSSAGWVLEGEEVVTSWYTEREGYDYLGEPRDTQAGHFTQLVWKESRKLGVGLAKSATTGRFLCVMKYWPSGNYVGQYLSNVLPPLQ